MNKTYKFRIYPNNKQEKILKKHLSLCCFIYNKQLELKTNTYKQNKKSLSKFDLNNNLIKLKKQNKQLKQVHSQVLQNINDRIHKAFKSFFLRLSQKKKGKKIKVGFPRFKPNKRYKSITYPQSGFKLEKKLILSKIGNIKIKQHREIKGTIKTLCIKRTQTGKWYALFTVEQEKQITNKLFKKKFNQKREIGIDLGLNSFAVLSNGKTIQNPKYLRKSEEKLKFIQKRHSRKKKNSNNRRKSRLKIARIYEKITNQRNDFLHKQSRILSRTYSRIAVEKLHIKNMQKNHHLAKSISDASWSRFLQYLSYKVAETGGQIVEINPNNTSQLCSNCGNKVKKSLATRIHKCPFCGLKIDRDLNASINILNKSYTSGTGGINACGDERLLSSTNQDACHFSGL